MTGCVSQVLAIYFLYTVLPQNELKRLISNGDWQSPTSPIVTGRKQIAKMTIGVVPTVYWMIQCQKSYSHCLVYVPDLNNLSRRGKVHEKYISSKIAWGLCLWRRWVQCWLLLWDEDSTAAPVLAAQGHMLPPAKSLLTDTQSTESPAMRGQWEPEMTFHQWPIHNWLSLHGLHFSVSCHT